MCMHVCCLGKSMNSILYDAWNSASGEWKKSKFLQNIRERHTQKRRGVRKWFLEKELVTRFGPEIASAIMQRKHDDPELTKSEIRDFPEAPDTWLSYDLCQLHMCVVDCSRFYRECAITCDLFRNSSSTLSWTRTLLRRFKRSLWIDYMKRLMNLPVQVLRPALYMRHVLSLNDRTIVLPMQTLDQHMHDQGKKKKKQKKETSKKKNKSKKNKKKTKKSKKEKDNNNEETAKATEKKTAIKDAKKVGGKEI